MPGTIPYLSATANSQLTGATVQPFWFVTCYRSGNDIVVVPIRSGVGLRLGSQCWLSQIHATPDVEPVLITKASPPWGTETPFQLRRHLLPVGA